MNMAEPLHFHGLRGNLRRDEPMSRHVSWRAGGRARVFYVPADLPDLASFLRQLPAAQPVLFVGLGSNLLVRDGGFPGTVILMHAATRRPELRDGRIYAEAWVAAPKVARFATWDIVEQVLTVDREAVFHVRRKAEFEIGYRHCGLPKVEWFAAAWFELESGDGGASRAKIKELLARRIATQPLSLPNAGSVFRNPPHDHAARLIEACGLKGFGRGGARVSEKHANFIVNPQGAASAADIEWLIGQVKQRVLQRQGIELVPEVRIVGEAA